MMEAFSNPAIEKVVLMLAAQTGKTECLNNVCGYYMDHEPSPILVILPTLEIAKSWSKDRLAPMIRDTEILHYKVSGVRARGADNTIFHKTFLGGHITIAGANSPASLASRPIRVVLCDEVDRYPLSAGAEGDPVDLAFKRSTTFWNRKVCITSTPTIKGLSRIEKAYDESDKRKFYVPCPHCNEYMVLHWANVRWPKDSPMEAVYACEFCQGEINDADKIRIVRQGMWKSERKCTGIAGFWLNELYSPWVSFANMATRFLEAKYKGAETLKVFINTALAETWEEEGESVRDSDIMKRCEKYQAEVPKGVGILTAAADVQNDRIEALTVGWGVSEEAWVIDWHSFYGNPANIDDQCWKDLDEYFLRPWLHVTGTELKVSCACIDTGHHSKTAYAFIRPRQMRRVFAIKGGSEPGKPIVTRPTRNSINRVKLFMVGTDTAKETLYSRLKSDTFGPGYVHFHDNLDEEFFKQLTAEKIVTRYYKGMPRREWVKMRARNEALDMFVYNMAALAIINPRIETLVKALEDKEAEVIEQPEQKEPEHFESSPDFKRVRPRGWVKGWR